MNPTSIREQLAKGKLFLKGKAIESCSLDAQLLLMEAAGVSKALLYTNGEDTLTEEQIGRYWALLAERGLKKPVQYLLKRCEFMSLDFYVDENVLIPRPDSETLAESAIAHAKQRGCRRILDMGTGSGCIAVSLAHYCADVRVTAVDISEKALLIAAENARLNRVSDRITFVKSDLFASVEKTGQGFDIIVSNPPYIKDGDVSVLDDSVKNFEPHTALRGGPDGLFFYREIARECRRFMSNPALLLFETGYDQGRAVKDILMENGFCDITITKDLAGLDRVVSGQLKGTP